MISSTSRRRSSGRDGADPDAPRTEGNYGLNPGFAESHRPWARGMIVRWDCERPSNYAAEQAANKKKPFKLDTVRELYSILAPDEKAKGLPFRKENPLHRLYYHDIAPPEKILPSMRKLGEWIDDPGTRHLHVIERVATLHSRFMAIFPWAKESGRTIRIASNLLLQEGGYPIAIVHSIDRQRYYESLRGDHLGLTSLYLEAVQTTAETEMRVYDEANKNPSKRRRKRDDSPG